MIRERFDAACEEAVSGCWNWLGPFYPNGYGRFSVCGKYERAHRYSYELHVGPIPAGMLIDHTCHNVACVNPAHLRLATNKQNLENLAHVRSPSGYRGVTWHKRARRWYAAVTHNGQKFSLGYFDDPAEAGAVAKAKRLELFTHNDADRVPA